MANLPPGTSGPIIANLTEDGLVAWVGALTNVYDPDTFILRAIDIPPLPPGVTYDAAFGSFIIDSLAPAWQSLAAGQVVQVRIDYLVTDGEFVVPHALVINMTGVNDVAVVSGITTGAVTEDAVLTAEGQVFVSDVDQGEAALAVPQSPLQGSFGSLTVTADGHWTYVLDNSRAAVQALNDGDTRAEVFTLQTIDGTAVQIAISIGGATERLIAGTAGDDVLSGSDFGESFMGLGGRDRISGNGGSDTLDGGAGADSLYGGLGDDVVIFDALDRVLDGGAGVDTLGIGSRASVNLGAADQVSGDNGVTTGFENVDGTRSTQSLTLTGSAGDNILFGGSAGDRITGGLGADVLYGNGGSDRFVFRSLAEATGDEIGDFTHGSDRIDVSAIDAISGGSNNAFTFIGGAAFTRAGQLRYDAAAGQVLGDVNGDRLADFVLDIGAGLVVMATDFVL